MLSQLLHSYELTLWGLGGIFLGVDDLRAVFKVESVSLRFLSIYGDS